MAATNAFIENQKTLTASYAKRHCLIEYVLIDGVNDSIETAHALGALLQGCSVLLNVIPYNPTAVPFDYKPPTMAAQTAFVAVTRDVYGVKTILRQTMGQDVSAACGQLVIEQRNIKKPVASCSSGGDDGSVEEEEKKTKKNGDGVVDLEDLLAKTAGKSNTTRVKIAEAATTLRKRNINSSSAIAASNTVEESGRDSGSLVQHALFLIVIASLISLVLFRQFTNNQ